MAFSFLAGCEILQTENSFSKDLALYGVSSGGTAAFIALKTVLQSNCASCHSDFVSYTEEEWVDNGYVIRGDADNSSLYQRLRGSNTGGPENMPPDSTLTTDEISVVNAWITGL